jgi:HEAT repeat protein
MIVVAAVIIFFPAAHARAADEAASSQEKEFIAVLQSDAAAADKAIACKRLAISGSAAAVPDLAKLLPDPQLSSWARIALEAIPGPEADAALRSAAESLDGLLQVGVINSIGVRRDAAAVETLAARLTDEDAEVASAAAVALGHIGDAAAAKHLSNALAAAPPQVRSAVAEGCVLCAERMVASKQLPAAIELYDQVRKADVHQQRQLDATRGAILAREQDGLPLLVELLQSPDKKLFQLGLSTAREFPGTEVDKSLAAELATAPPQRAALLVAAMADRPLATSLPAFIQAAGAGAKPVRLAAIGALSRVGDASCLATLLEVAGESDKDLAQAAKEALASLPGDKVDAQITTLLATAKGGSDPLLIELVGQRRIPAAPQLLKALDHAQPKVRQAALIALGETVELKQLSVLIGQALAPRYAEDGPVAQQALRAASVRMPDREACAAELAAAVQRAKGDAKVQVLEILAEVGGTKALATLAAASKSQDDSLQDAGSRLLGKWNSVEAAPVLLDLAKTAPQAKYQIRALRGYLGLARKFAMPEAERVAMCKQAFAIATQPAEQKLVLDVLAIHPSTEGLQFALDVLEKPGLKDDATQAVLVIAQKVGGQQGDVAARLSKAGLAKVKLEIIKAEYGAGETRREVTEVLRKHASDSPLVALPNGNYNGAFGGDPSPGTAKQLRIQYRLDGKEGTANFAENALIFLPVPK